MLSKRCPLGSPQDYCNGIWKVHGPSLVFRDKVAEQETFALGGIDEEVRVWVLLELPANDWRIGPRLQILHQGDLPAAWKKP